MQLKIIDKNETDNYQQINIAYVGIKLEISV